MAQFFISRAGGSVTGLANPLVADLNAASFDLLNVDNLAVTTVNGQPVVAMTITGAAQGDVLTRSGTEFVNSNIGVSQYAGRGSSGNVIGISPKVAIGVACSDETTDLTTGTAKVTFRMPYAMTLTEVRGSLTTVATGATLLTVDINEAGTTVISTKLTFDASESTTTTAVTPAVISDASLADDAVMTVDIDAIGNTTPGRGLKIWLIGTRAT